METGTIHHKLENISSLSSTKLVQVQVLEAFFFFFKSTKDVIFIKKWRKGEEIQQKDG